MKKIAASLLLFVGMITTSFAVTYSVNPGATYGPIGYSSGNEQSLAVMVPSGTSKLTIQTWGGSGDADLYFKASGPATHTSYTLGSTGSSTSETITVNNPASGWNYFTIYAFSNYSGLYFNASLQQTQVAQVATPVINPGGQSSLSPITVTISCPTSGATIRYTTNGSDPTSSSAIYPGAFTLSTSSTVKARAFKSGMTDSAVATTSYSIVIPSVTTLSNGSAVTGLSGAASSERQFKINVPSGQSKLEIKISGGTGNADLYVRRGSTPTTSSYDVRPYLVGNDETATVLNPASGDWYVMVRGFSSYSGLTLVGTYAVSNSYAFKLPLFGNEYWRCTTPAGGLYYDGTKDEGHAGNNFYSLDFSWRTLSGKYKENDNIPIYAMHSGKVIWLATSPQDYNYTIGNGYSVRIDQDGDGNASTGLISTYIHLKSSPSSFVSNGSVVPEGTLLGYMGTTGNSTGVHLHLGLRYNADGSYGTGGLGQAELEKVTIEGLKVRSFQQNAVIGQQPGYYRSSR